MFTNNRTLSLLLIGLLLNLSLLHITVLAGIKEEKHTAKVKAGIAKLGIGNESRVKVKLRDKREIKGYISEITEDSFTVVSEKTSLATNISYSQVKQVKGNNLSTGVRIAIGIAVIFAVFAVFALISLAREGK